MFEKLKNKYDSYFSRKELIVKQMCNCVNASLGRNFTYVWEVPASAGPGDSSSSTIIWPYESIHHQPVLIIRNDCNELNVFFLLQLLFQCSFDRQTCWLGRGCGCG